METCLNRWSHTRRPALTAVACLIALTVAACSSSEPEREPEPEPTRVVATITATETANPNRDGRASPILLRIYELTSDSKFNAVSFFDLYDSETAALGAELRAREQIPLNPGDETTLEMAPQEGSRFVGAAAAFQDIDNSIWRAVTDIPPNETTRLAIEVDGTTLTITRLPPPEAPPPEEE